MAEEKEEKKKKKLKKAQLTSLISKILGVSFLIVMYTLYCLKKVSLDVDDLIKVTLTVVGLCGTIDINIFTDKILSYKKEKGERGDEE
jgi:hypothetical protein